MPGDAHVHRPGKVVPRKGDVDRNFDDRKLKLLRGESSPARGTWIEIFLHGGNLRKGRTSSPARGTWIEMPSWSTAAAASPVVPRKGDVDRNAMAHSISYGGVRRPPQGGRG